MGWKVTRRELCPTRWCGTDWIRNSISQRIGHFLSVMLWHGIGSPSKEITLQRLYYPTPPCLAGSTCSTPGLLPELQLLQMAAGKYKCGAGLDSSRLDLGLIAPGSWQILSTATLLREIILFHLGSLLRYCILGNKGETPLQHHLENLLDCVPKKTFNVPMNST